MREEKEELEKAFAQLKHLLNDLDYGSVTLVVQDGKIVQMEKKEKVRLT